MSLIRLTPWKSVLRYIVLLVVVGCQDATAPQREPRPSSIIVDPTQVVLSPGETRQLEVRVHAADGSSLVLTDLLWTSSDTLSARVGSLGQVTGVGAGRSTVTVTKAGLEARADIRVVGVNPTRPIRGDEEIWVAANRWEELFSTPSGWPTLRERAHIAKFYPWWIDDIAPSDLESATSQLNAAHIAIAMESGGLRPAFCTGDEVAELELPKLAKIRAAGGALSFISLDTPFGTTMDRATPDGCGHSAQRVAEELLRLITRLRAVSPELRIGLTEPVPWYWVNSHPPNPGNDFGDLIAVIDTLTSVLATGNATLDFFHADSPFDYSEAHPNGWRKLRDLEAAVEARGIRFGLIYNSEEGGTTSDALYHEHTLSAFEAFRGVGGQPDDLIVQSWYPLPSLMVPENHANTFSNVFRDFIAMYDTQGVVRQSMGLVIPMKPSLHTSDARLPGLDLTWPDHSSWRQASSSRRGPV